MSIPSAVTDWQSAPGQRTPPVSLRGLPQTGTWRDAMLLLGHGVRPLAPFGLPGQATLRSVRGAGLVAAIPRAPGFLDVDRAKALRRLLGVRHLIVQPERIEEADFLRTAGFRQIGRPECILEFDLTKSQAELMAAMSRRWRSRLSDALGPALTVSRSAFSADPRHWLLAQLGTQVHQPGPATLTPREIAAICAVRPGTGQVITVRRAGSLVAIALFLRHGAVATCQVAWVSEAGRAMAAGHLALWRSMLELRHMGVHRISFGAAGPTARPHPSDFWTGAGGRTRIIGGHWLDSAWLPRRAVRARPLPPASLASGAGLALR